MKKLLIGLASLILSITLSPNISAEENPFASYVPPLSEKDFQEIVSISFEGALRLTDYTPNGHVTPLVQIVPDSVIQVSLGCKENCGVQGLYAPETNTIYVGESVIGIPGILAAGLFVHEIVHYLQYVNDVDFSVCESRRDAEVEAYKTQDAFLRHFGFNPTWEWPAREACEGRVVF